MRTSDSSVATGERGNPSKQTYKLRKHTHMGTVSEWVMVVPTGTRSLGRHCVTLILITMILNIKKTLIFSLSHSIRQDILIHLRFIPIQHQIKMMLKGTRFGF